eukprot:3873516-Heterocapsa_arctica.AAC.1
MGRAPWRRCPARPSRCGGAGPLVRHPVAVGGAVGRRRPAGRRALGAAPAALRAALLRPRAAPQRRGPLAPRLRHSAGGLPRRLRADPGGRGRGRREGRRGPAGPRGVAE